MTARWFNRIHFAVLENHGWNQVQDCQFVKWFRDAGVIFEHWYGAGHPSGPNYRTLLSGHHWSWNEFDGVWRENVADHVNSIVLPYAGIPADRHNPFKDMQSGMMTVSPAGANIIYYGMDDLNDGHTGDDALTTADQNIMHLTGTLQLAADEAFFLFFDEAFGLPVEYLANHVFAAVVSPALTSGAVKLSHLAQSASFSHRDFAAMLYENWSIAIPPWLTTHTDIFA